MLKIERYHLHLPYNIFNDNKELQFLYFVRIARNLIDSLVFFFIPLFLFELANSVTWSFFSNFSTFQKGILLISLYHVVVRLAVFFLSIPIAKIIIKIGYKFSFVIANFLHMSMLIFLKNSMGSPALIFLAAFVEGIQVIFFWNTFHTVLSKKTNTHKMGESLGALKLLLNFFALISPALGGLIIVAFGYQNLFFVGMVITLFSIIFSLLVKNNKIKDRVSCKEFFSWLRERSYLRLSLSFAGRYIHDASIMLWPLYVFILLGSADKVGYIYSLSLFIAMIISYFTGSFLDRNKRKGPFFLSASILSVIWFLRAQVITPLAIAMIDTFDRLIGSFHWMFYERLWILRGKGREALSYFIYREIIISFFAIIFWISFAFIFLLLPSGWQSLFIIAAVGVLLTILVEEHK